MRLALVALAFLVMTMPRAANAQACPLPDPNQSYFVPQAGTVAAPSEGAAAIRFFRACPNNDGGSSLPQNARIKVVLRDAAGVPLVGVSPDQIYTLFNGGTPAQGFFGPGADSIISNTMWNPAASCPDVRRMKADAPTDAAGTTYITFGGSSAPGVYARDPGIKWGHFDFEIPVYVGLPPCNPILLKGKFTSAAALGSYALRIKNTDVVGGLAAVLNQGEAVTVSDFNTCVACAGGGGGIFCYWCDLDWSGAIGAADLNIVTSHFGHNCQTPLSP